MIPIPLQAVVFDMDGLLLDTEAVYRTASIAVAPAFDIEVTPAFYAETIGHPKDRTEALFRATFGSAFRFRDYAAACRQHVAELCHAGVPLKQGAAEILDLLRRRNIPAAVATSTARDTAVDHLRRAGLIDFFQAIVTRSDVTMGKPHPETFLAAAAQLEASPVQCLALEDSHNGVRAAHAAGMAVVMVPDLLDPTDDIRALCAGVVTSLHEVRDAILRAPSQHF